MKTYDSWRVKIRMLDKLFGQEDYITELLNSPPEEEKDDELPKLQDTEDE